jgi:transposase
MREKRRPDPAHLPDDPSLLKQIIAQQNQGITELHSTVEKLRHEMDRLRRMHFGPRSERIVPEQMVMAFATQSFPAQLPPPAPPREKRRDPQHFDPAQALEGANGHGRQRLPDHLKRVKVVLDVPEGRKRCTSCRKELVKIGEETSEQLEYTQAQCHVIQNVRPKYACPDECEETGIVIAPPPSGPIEKGLPGPGMLGYVCVAKYDDHLPAYRQQEIFARQGVHIARQTLCGWIAAAAELLSPLVLLMARRILLSKKIHTDDVPVPVLDPNCEHTREGRLWVYIGDDDHRYVVFDFSPDLREIYPIEFLKGFARFLQCDAYPGYEKTAGTLVGCWAHARRYFFDAEKSDPARSAIAIGFIRELYKVEEAARDLKAAERLALRQEHSKKTIEEFKAWLDGEELSVLPASAMGGAFTYARNQWERLTRYLDDGDLDIDNNIAERANRNVAIGRKNWLFAGSDEGGRRAAVLYSVIESAKANGVEPLAYLTDLFARIATHPASRLAELLPDQWKPRKPDTS